MDYKFADRVMDLKPSVIREILKFTSMPGVISFAAGNPAPEAFPVKEITEISAEIFEKRPIDALQYSITEGYPNLRKTVSERMKTKFDSFKDFDDIIITTGGQQVMNLATQSLCNEGDTIICEAPTFIGSLNAFRSFNAHLVGVPLEDDGMDLAKLEEALKTEKNVKFIYTIPNFQNPSGLTTSLEKRKGIYELAKKYGVMIIEDNPYGETRFAGEDVPNIKSLDTDGLVIYAGSFSKLISSGMRVGFAIAPKEVISKMTVCKQVSDVHTNIFSQLVVDELINKYDFEGHINKIRDIYRKKSGIMMNLLDELCLDKLSYRKVEGGLFIWCKLPDGVDMPQFCKTAVQQKIAVVPGNAFLVDENMPCSNFRINFSTPTDEQLVEGMHILADVLKTI